MNQKLNFDSATYRRLNLPLLWLSFIPSFLVDSYIVKEIFVTSTESFPGGEQAYRMWLAALIFLLICNQGLLKGIGIYTFFHVRDLRNRSHILMKPKEIVYFKVETVTSRREAEGANEGMRLPPDAKNEFLLTSIVHLNHVRKLYRHNSGAIEVEGDISVEMLDEVEVEGFSTYEFENRNRIEKRCVIPAYFEGIETIFHELKKMVE